MSREVPVWRRFVRLFHWSLVATVALLALRVVWGFAGSDRPARFASFVRGPAAVMAYTRAMLQQRAPRFLGHNPLGGWMVLALMLMLAAVAATGWLMTTDAFFGSEPVEQVHEALAVGLLGLVALHVTGVFYTGWHQGENLVRAMVTGRKHAPQPGDIDA